MPDMTLLFYCQHSLGMGHFIRSIALAERLACDFKVIFLNGGALPTGVPFPSSVERIDLPPLGMAEDGGLVSFGPALSVQQALECRRDLMMQILETRRPDVLLVELFPFGRKKFEPELIPLLEAARAQPRARPLVASSVRDLLVTGRVGQQRFDDRARTLCDRYFDLVLVHTDPTFAAFEESFRPTVPLRTPLLYTGFMARPDVPSPSDSREGVIVSAGGGLVGESLFRLAVDAHRLNWPAHRLRTTIVAGPFAPPQVLAWLQEVAASVDGLTVLPHVPDLRPLLACAAVSVSQCGYNTALDLVGSGVSALVVPYGDGQENEQTRRAERLAGRGLLRWAASTSLSAERLADAIVALLTFRPSGAGLLLDGAETTTAMLTAAAMLRTGAAEWAGTTAREAIQ